MPSQSPFRITSSKSDQKILQGPCLGARVLDPDQRREEYAAVMKTMTIRLSDVLALEIEAESRRRKLSKSGVVRERLGVPAHARKRSSASIDAIADLIGSVDGLARNLSGQKKKYLKSTGYGRNRSR
jgi:hypothetical protein